MECYGYLQVKYILEYTCAVQAKGAAYWHYMAGVEADVRIYVTSGLSEKVIFLEMWGDLDV